jgi:hypothetical protein
MRPVQARSTATLLCSEIGIGAGSVGRVDFNAYKDRAKPVLKAISGSSII